MGLREQAQHGRRRFGVGERILMHRSHFAKLRDGGPPPPKALSFTGRPDDKYCVAARSAHTYTGRLKDMFAHLHRKEMVMSRHPTSRSLLAVSLIVGALAACDRSPAAPLAADVDHTTMHAAHGASAGANALAAHGDLIKAVRQSTSRYNSTVQAVRAGYAPAEECVAHPVLGGMGFHWVNDALVGFDYDPLKPQVLLYAPGPGKNPQLVAIEYVVLAPPHVWEWDADAIAEFLAGDARPDFGGQPFDILGTPVPVPHWSLHVWVHRHNPSGMFTPFNPNVSCG